MQLILKKLFTVTAFDFILKPGVFNDISLASFTDYLDIKQVQL